ncbi:hypothetical protein A2U01_0060053, partial [Trifolium medium]|nr:hypothetical protein [Trifolium medium]
EVAGLGTIIPDSLQRLQSVHLVVFDNCSRETEDVVQMTAPEVCYMAQVKQFEWTATQGMRDRRDHERREIFSIKWQRLNLDVVKCNVDAIHTNIAGISEF